MAFIKNSFNFSLRVRLTFLFALIFGTTTLFFSLLIFYKLDESLMEDFDVALYNYSIDISQTITIGPKNDLSLPPLTVEEGKIYPFPSGTVLITVRHISGKMLVKTGDFGLFIPPHQQEIKKLLKGDDAAYTTITDTHLIPNPEAGSYRLITFPLDTEKNPTLFLQIAAPMVAAELQVNQLKNILKFGLPGVLLIAVLAGLYFARRALAPVQNMIRATHQINASDLHQRLPLPSSQDEIHELGRTLNEMLERIQKAFLSQERFVADASHQLMTPLTIMRGEIETRKAHAHDPDTQKLFQSVLQEINNLSKIVKDMLLLARIDAGQNTLTLQKNYLDEILIDVYSRLQSLAQSQKIQLQLNFHHQEHRKPVLCDSDLISNILLNLIENAIKYSPPEQQVLVSLQWSEFETTITVEDFGPGISEEQQTQIFNRFSRGDSSSKTKGFGLGLAIAQKIAQLHQTEVVLLSKNSPGALFKISFKNDLES